MKKYSLIILFSFFFLINNVHAEYYLTPNRFTMFKTNTTLQFDYYGENTGDMSSVFTLDGNTDTWFRFQFDLDGSNCGSNIDSAECFNTIHAIEDGGVSNTIYGSFQMCVSKPQFHWVVDWSSCNDNCLKKSQDLIIINNSYQNCTLGLYDTETGSNMENDGYLVNVYYDIAKWEYIEGAFSGIVNGRIYLYNDSDSILYYRFVDNVLLSDRNMASWDSGYGIFNHDYTQPDIGGETFLNDGTCVFSYNKMNNYSYTNNWDRQTSTLTFNNSLPYEKLPGTKNLLNLSTYYSRNANVTLSSTGFTSYNTDSGPSRVTFPIDVESGKKYIVSFDYTLNSGALPAFFVRFASGRDSGVWVSPSSGNLSPGHITYTFTAEESTTIYLWIYFNSNQLNQEYNATISNLQVEFGSNSTKYMPYGGYYVSYTNLQAEMAIFHYYDTNLYEPGNIYIYYENYDNDYELIDMVNCSNSYVCKYENIYSFSHLSNILNPSKDWVKNIKIYWTGIESIYFEKPYIYDLYDVPGRATWKEYYMPAGTYICSNNQNGTYYNAQNKEVYYNPDNPPKIVSSNPNGQSQNIFGIEVNFYGLSGLFNIPIQIINNIKNGTYNNCQPLDIPFPGFPDKHLYMPCMTDYVYNRYPVLLSIYRVIIYGAISLRIGIGTLKYIKKWYDGTIESGD